MNADPCPSPAAPPLPHENTESYLRRTDSICINNSIFGRRLLQWCARNPTTEIAAKVGWAMNEFGGIYRIGASDRLNERSG